MGDIVITPASNDVNSTAGTLVLRSSDLNPISLRTNNTNRLFIDPTGSVGLGTAVPTGGLHINYAPGAFSEALRLQRNGGVFYSFGLDTNFLNIAYNGNVNANNVLVLTNGGYLGVGNLQNAFFNLDVASTQGKGIQLRYDASTGYRAQITPYWNTNIDSRIDFAINRSANLVADVIMSVGYDNNVGIGTTRPSGKLQIVGVGTNPVSLLTVGNLNNNWGGVVAIGTHDGNGIILSKAGGASNDTNRVLTIMRDDTNGASIAGYTPAGASTSIGYLIRANASSYFSGGNVGIGETSPDYRLTVHNRPTSSSNSDVEIVCGGGGQASVRLFEDNLGNHTSYGARMYYEGADNNFFNIATIDNSTETHCFTIDRYSKVGIGTTNPFTKLRVNGSFSQRASGNPAIQEYKNIVTFNLDNNGTGGYVIKTPFRLGTSYEMVIIHVKGYGYGAASLYDFKIVFYDYAPSNAPLNYSIVDLGNDGSPKYLAKDANNDIQICFGNLGDVNYYYRFTVDCITTRNNTDYSQGWAMYQTTSANFGFASTGIYALNPPINFRTNNNVGVGTTNPVQKFQVEGTVGNPAFVGTTQSGIVRISNTTDNAVLDFGIRAGGSGAWIQSTDETSLAANYPLLLNPNGGSVGIGISNPIGKLTVQGNIEVNYNSTTADTFVRRSFLTAHATMNRGSNISFGLFDGGSGPAGMTVYNTAAAVGAYNSQFITFLTHEGGVSEGERMRITQLGDVGIGTFTPSGKLHVEGNIFSSANIIGTDGTRGYLLGKDSLSAGRCYLILDPDAADGIGVGSDYLYIAQENTTGVISNSAGPLLLNPGGGSVGIGTTNAVAQFHIGGTASNNNPWMVLDINDTYFKRIVFSEERPAYGTTAYGGYIGYDASANTVSLGTYENSVEKRSINILRDNGNVGIGITNPTYTLQVAGTFYVNSTSFFNGAMTVEDSITVDGRLNGSDGIALLKMRAGNSAGSWNDANIQYEKNSSADSLHFNMGDTTISNATVKLTVQNNGNIGIGTTRPAGLLHVFSTTGRYINYTPGSVSGLLIQKNASVASQGTTVLTLVNAQGTESLVDRGTSLNLDIGYGGTISTAGTIARGARIAALNHNAYDATAANQNAYLSFYTATGGTLTEKVRIKGDGNVGIGTTAIDARLVVLGEMQVSSNTVYTTHFNYGNIGLNFISTANAGATYFRGSDNAVTAMVVNGAGTVGIGVASPATILGVGGAGSTSPASGITFGNDAQVNLYRISEDVLRTDANLNVLGYVSVGGYIYTSAYLQVAQGNIYPGGYTSDLNLNIGNTAGNNWETAIKIRPGSYVGIGTTQPSGKLHVVSTVAGETVLRADGTNGTLFSVVDNLSDSLMSVNNSAGLPVLEVFADDKVVMGQYASGDFVLVNNKIGIGTTNPNNKLSVIGGASIGSTTYNTAAPTNGLLVQGNVGIGLTNPSVRLEVYSTAATIANFGGNQASQLFYLGNSSATSYSDLIIRANDGQAEFFRAGNGYGSWGGASALNIYNSNGPIAFHANNTANSMFLSSAGYLGIGATVPAEKLDVRGGIIRSNARISNDEGYPVGHHSAGETVFEIDPTWSQLELQKYFNSSNVTWVAVADAPGGYCIYIDGGVNVGGFADSGFPYIPVDTNDIFYMECWIQNVGTNQGHYMGSQDFDQNFSSLGGNPGSYGYWVMSNYNATTTWTKVSGYISGFSASEVGKFKTGTKYWTPQALFNYTAGTGTRACRISGWKIIKVSHVGDRSFAGNVNVAADLYVADELAVGLPITAKRVNYGAQINAASASIQLVFGRSATSLGSGAIGADENNTFAVYNVSGGITKQFSITQQGNVGIGNLTPTSKLYIEGGSANWSETTPGTALGTIHLDPGVTTDNFGNAITFGASDSADGTTAQAGIYVRSDGGYGTKMYFATTDSYGDGSKTRMFISHSGNVGIATTNPIHKLQIGNFTSTSTNSTEKISLGGTYSDTPGSNIKMRVYDDNTSIGGMGVSSGQMEINTWSAGKIAFYRATTQMAVFNANGNLGIGNVLPNGARVHIKTDTTNPSLRIEDPLIEGPAGGTAGRALRGWLPIMTGALATDKVYIPLYGPLA